MKRKWLALLTIASVLIFVVAGCAPEAAPSGEKPPVEKPPEKITWKFAHLGVPGAGGSAFALEWFFDEVQERSGDRFEIKCFWSQSLCPAKEQLNAVNSGLCEGTGIYPGYYTAQLPLFNISTLPCLFPTEDSEESYLAFAKIMQEWIQTPLLKEEFGKWDAIAMGETYLPFYTMMGKVRISNLADLKGKRIRAAGGMVNLFTNAGAAPISVIIPEIYDALSKGTVDMVALGWGQFLSYKIYEASKYWTQGINLMQSSYPIVLKQTAYEALPEDIRQIIQELADEMLSVVAANFANEYSPALETFKKAGVENVQFSAEDNQKLREIAKGIWKEYVDKLEGQGLPGKEAFNSLQDVIKKHVPGYQPSYL